MEEQPLTPEETTLLAQVTNLAFREMGERTRAGSGDDQAYVDEEYARLQNDPDAQRLVRIRLPALPTSQAAEDDCPYCLQTQIIETLQEQRRLQEQHIALLQRLNE